MRPNRLGSCVLRVSKPILLFLVAIFVSIKLTAQCSSTAALSAGNIINDNSIGVFNFSSPGNAATSNNSRASASAIITILSGNTNYLKATGFNFAIPSTAAICGIMVEVEKSASNISLLATVTDNSVRLVKGGNVTGNIMHQQLIGRPLKIIIAMVV